MGQAQGADDGVLLSLVVDIAKDRSFLLVLDAGTLAELARVVKPGGPIASLEFAVPTAPWWRIAWWFYTRIVLPIAGLITGGRAWFRVGRFLGPSIAAHYRTYPFDWTIAAWNDAGIEKVGTRAMSLGGGRIMWGQRAR